MGRFARKTVDQRVKPGWEVKTCLLETFKKVLEKDAENEFWLRYGNQYFQAGASSDYDKERGFFDKVYYLNLKTDDKLGKLLNLPDEEVPPHMCRTAHLDEMLGAEMFGTRGLKDIWPQVEIVGIGEMDPRHTDLDTY